MIGTNPDGAATYKSSRSHVNLGNIVMLIPNEQGSEISDDAQVVYLQGVRAKGHCTRAQNL